jgi:hypothetical protein
MSQRKDVYIGAHLDDPSKVIERIASTERSDNQAAVAKLEALLDKIELEEARLEKGGGEDPIAKNDRLLTEIERLAADPDYFSKKRAREDALEKWRNEPLPPKCAGPGVPHLTAETVQKLAKRNGFGQREGDYFRK